MRKSTKIEIIKKNQIVTSGLKNSVNGMEKIYIKCINRPDQAEERISKFIDSSFEISQATGKKGK